MPLPIRIEECPRCGTRDRIYDDHDFSEWGYRHQGHLHETRTVYWGEEG